MTNPPRSVVIKTGIIRTASNIDKTADHFSEDIFWLWLNAVDQDTSSKQEAAIVLIYSCQYIFTPLQSFNTQPPEGG